MFVAINKKVELTANFGVGKAGLATVGYKLVNGDGSTFQARTTTGVTELQAGTGIYGVEVAATVFTAAFDGYVLWDTGGGSPVYVAEDIYVSDRLDVAVSSRATAAMLASVAADVASILARTPTIRGADE